MSTIATKCLACKDATGQMIAHTIQRRAVGPKDVHIKVSYSGICHSDIHTGKGEWGPKSYPLCVGHEVVGTVVAVGAEVTKLKVGETAGVGCMVDSCRTCEECESGDEQYCSNGGMVGTYGAATSEAKNPGGFTHGGYSSDIVVDEAFTIVVPAKMHVAAAAPLLCAGITCYSPLQKHGVKKGTHLGVVGLGGLGHMAVKIGVAMGAIVTVITTSEAKREMALKARTHAYAHAHAAHGRIHARTHAHALNTRAHAPRVSHEQLGSSVTRWARRPWWLARTRSR